MSITPTVCPSARVTPAVAGPLRLLPAVAGVLDHRTGQAYLVPVLAADIPQEHTS